MRRPAHGLWLAVLALTALAAGGLAHAERTLPPVVERICAGCHGRDGNYGWPQVPRLAAQNADYVAAQLKAYALAPAPSRAEVPAWLVPPEPLPPDARGDRDGITFMVGIARALAPQEIDDAAAWYAAQAPAPGRPGDPALTAQGRLLFDRGVPDKGIAACRDCHGAEGAGVGPFPRVAGQHAGYLRRQLRAFAAGSRPHAGPMTGIAKELSGDEIRALAAYLQSL